MHIKHKKKETNKMNFAIKTLQPPNKHKFSLFTFESQERKDVAR